MYLNSRPKDHPYYMGIWIVEDENLATLSRTVETIWDVLADTGGFSEIVFLIAFFIVFHY